MCSLYVQYFILCLVQILSLNIVKAQEVRKNLQQFFQTNITIDVYVSQKFQNWLT